MIPSKPAKDVQLQTSIACVNDLTTSNISLFKNMSYHLLIHYNKLVPYTLQNFHQ